MLRTVSSLIVVAWSTTLWSAAYVPEPTPITKDKPAAKANANANTNMHPHNLRPKLAMNGNPSSFGVETKNRQRPVHVEQDCPSPDLVDYVKTTSWNNMEAGISFPIGGDSDARLYTRYTCDAPKTEPY